MMAAGIGVLAMMFAGCRTSDPIITFSGCLIPAVEVVRANAGQREQHCELGGPVTLVALPSRVVTTVELMKAGVSEDAMPLLSTADTTGLHRWCILSRTNPRGGATKPGWDVSCIPTEIEIANLTVVRAASVTVTLDRSATGVRLVGMR